MLTGLASTITSVGILGSKYTTVVLSDWIFFQIFECRFKILGPFPKNILVCKHLKGFTDSRIILEKSRTVASHAKKSTYTKFFYYSGWIYFYYCYDLLWVWGDSVWAEYYSKKWFFISWLNWHFVFFYYVLVQPSWRPQMSAQGHIMLFIYFAITVMLQCHLICFCSINALNDTAYWFLKNLRCWRYSKILSLVLINSNIGFKGGDVSWFFTSSSWW